MGQKVVNYVGWLGNQNLGDHALFLATSKIFKGYTLRPYNSYKFLTSASNPFLPRIENQFSRVVLFGGGTLLPDDSTWIKPGRYNYMFGTGIKNPIFRSKFNNFHKVVINRLKSYDFRFIGVRDHISKDLLADWGIDSEVIGDPALSLKQSLDIKRNESRIAVNVGCDGNLWGGDQGHVVNELTHVCKTLKDNGYNLILIPFSKYDLPHINRISENASIEVFDKWSNLQSVTNLIGSCKVMIGERLHSVVLSAATYTPLISIEYRPKCLAFSESVGFSRYSLRTDKLTADQIIEMFGDLLNNWSQMHNLLARKVDDFRERQKKFGKRIISDLESLPNDAWANAGLGETLKSKIFWDTDVIMRKNFGNVWQIYNQLVFLRIMEYLI